MGNYVIEIDFCASNSIDFAHIVVLNRAEAVRVWESIMTSPLSKSIYLTSLYRLPKGEKKVPRLGIWRTGSYKKFANKEGEIEGESSSHLNLDFMWACGCGLVWNYGNWKVEGLPNFYNPFTFNK